MIRSYLLLLCVSTSLMACDSFEDLQRDPNRATEVNPALLLTSIEATAFNEVSLASALASRHLRRHPNAQPVVLVVTDGEPTAHLEDFSGAGAGSGGVFFDIIRGDVKNEHGIHVKKLSPHLTSN